MKKKSKALIPILIALIAMAALGQAEYDTETKNNCNYQMDIIEGTSTSAEVTLNATSPQNITLVWYYEDERPLQSYFRSKSGFSTDFQLRDNRTLDRIEVRSMDCDNISDRYP